MKLKGLESQAIAAHPHYLQQGCHPWMATVSTPTRPRMTRPTPWLSASAAGRTATSSGSSWALSADPCRGCHLARPSAGRSASRQDSADGFGRKVELALDESRQQSIMFGLATQREDGGIRYYPDLLATLQRRELDRVGQHVLIGRRKR